MSDCAHKLLWVQINLRPMVTYVLLFTNGCGSILALCPSLVISNKRWSNAPSEIQLLPRRSSMKQARSFSMVTQKLLALCCAISLMPLLGLKHWLWQFRLHQRAYTACFLSEAIRA